MPVGRARNTRKGHAESVWRQSRQRLRCVRPYNRFTNTTNRHGGICGTSASKSHRRRVRSTKLKIKHQSTEGALRLGVLRG